MKALARVFAVAWLLAGCATGEPRTTQATGPAHTGEVWNWDAQEGTITLRQGDRFVRVKAAPDQFTGLQLHQVRTIRGELVPPSDLVFTTPAPGFVPAGPADESRMTGTIGGVDPAGKAVVNTAGGRLEVWVAEPGNTMFKGGDQVQVRMRVQPLAPVQGGQTPAPPTVTPATQPGDYAVVRGSVLAVEPDGRLTVESPRGPIVVAVPSPTRYRKGDQVEVATSLHPGP